MPGYTNEVKSTNESFTNFNHIMNNSNKLNVIIILLLLIISMNLYCCMK